MNGLLAALDKVFAEQMRQIREKDAVIAAQRQRIDELLTGLPRPIGNMRDAFGPSDAADVRERTS